MVIYFNAPFSSGGVPWESDFDWSLFNYTPVVTGGVFIAVGLWWLLSAHKWFTGPRHTVVRDRCRARRGGADLGVSVAAAQGRTQHPPMASYASRSHGG